MSQPKSASLFRVAAGCGVSAPVLAFTCIMLSITSYPQFSWTQNALSDLGIVPGVTATIFNFGLYASGLMCLNFAVFGLFTLLRERLVGKAGAFTFAAACLALMAIGFFPENVKPTHYFASVAFFVLMPISMLIVAGAFWLEGRSRMAELTLIMAFAAAAPWILLLSFRYVSGVAIPEAVSGLAGSIWVIGLSANMLKQASRSKLPPERSKTTENFQSVIPLRTCSKAIQQFAFT